MRVHPRRLACVWAMALLLRALVAAAEDAPRVVTDAPVHDFGTVEQGAAVEHVFKLRNTGTTPLRVDHVKSTCACTVGVATGEPVEPGGETWVTVRLETARLAGRTAKTVTVYTNDPAAPAVALTLTGLVLTDLVVTPVPVYLGHVHRGSAVRRTLTVVPGRPDGTAVVTGAELSSPHAQVSLRRAPDGRGQEITIELDAALPLGRFDDDLVLRTTSPRQPTITVRVFGTIEGDLAVLPPQVTFGVAQGEAAEPREVYIRNQGRRRVEVTKVTAPDGIAVDLETVEAGVEYRLSLHLRDGLPPGKIDGAVEIFTSHPDEPRLVVPVSGVVRRAERRG